MAKIAIVMMPMTTMPLEIVIDISLVGHRAEQVGAERHAGGGHGHQQKAIA